MLEESYSVTEMLARTLIQLEETMAQYYTLM